MGLNQYLNAVVDTRIPQGSGTQFVSYHTIKNQEDKLRKFETFILKRFPQAWYANYYYKHLPKGKNFAFRRYLQ